VGGVALAARLAFASDALEPVPLREAD
jgi:hypothetical protein